MKTIDPRSARGAALLGLCALLGAPGCASRDAAPSRDGQAPADGSHLTDGGRLADAPRAGEAGPPSRCVQIAVRSRTPLALPRGAQGESFGLLLGANDGYLVVGPATGQGPTLTRVGLSGELLGTANVPWPGAAFTRESRAAVNGKAVALAVGWPDARSPGRSCTVGFAALDGSSVKTPARVSDPSGTRGMFPEVLSCEVAAFANGFAAVWAQWNTEKERALYLQRFDLQGAPVGARLLIVRTSDAKGLQVPTSVAWTGRELVVSHAGEGDAPMLSRVDEAGKVQSTRLPSPAQLGGELWWTGSALHLRWGERVAWVDSAGRLLAGPERLGEAGSFRTVALPARTVLVRTFAPTGGQSYLVTQTVSDDLKSLGPPGQLLPEAFRGTFQTASARSGGGAAVLYDQGKLELATLGCADAPQPAPGPLPCPERETVAPLDDGCKEPVCHAVLRFNLQTLGLEGYALLGGPHRPTDQATAEAIGKAYLRAKLGVGPGPDDYGPGMIDPLRSGIYRVGFSPGDIGGLALVSALSGQLVMTGAVVWAGEGDYWLPALWRPASDLACGKASAKPASPVATRDNPKACTYAPQMQHPVESQAVALALRTNLAQHFARRGPFELYSFLYTPAEGQCDPRPAEFVVVLSQKRP
ncbi:MAG: hypothetical protein IT371_13005 [Deltaproteobacteria bacterium]|nr:hypothetical protein [Deltaproteobacteria bacterium]